MAEKLKFQFLDEIKILKFFSIISFMQKQMMTQTNSCKTATDYVACGQQNSGTDVNREMHPTGRLLCVGRQQHSLWHEAHLGRRLIVLHVSLCGIKTCLPHSPAKIRSRAFNPECSQESDKKHVRVNFCWFVFWLLSLQILQIRV